MPSNINYLFTSERLGFRNWSENDSETMLEINSDETAMEFFPALPSEKETHDFITRMQQHFTEKGFCYFAVDILDTNTCIGFIGLMEKTFESDFTPCIDIGWRIKRTEWNKGFATEGAQRCLEYGFNELGIEKIVSMAPVINKKSGHIMVKIGMQKELNFKHPLLKGNERLEDCVLYVKCK